MLALNNAPTQTFRELVDFKCRSGSDGRLVCVPQTSAALASFKGLQTFLNEFIQVMHLKCCGVDVNGDVGYSMTESLGALFFEARKLMTDPNLEAKLGRLISAHKLTAQDVAVNAQALRDYFEAVTHIATRSAIHSATPIFATVVGTAPATITMTLGGAAMAIRTPVVLRSGVDFSCTTKGICTGLQASATETFKNLQRAANALVTVVDPQTPGTPVTGEVEADTVALISWLWPILRDTRGYRDAPLEAAVGKQLFAASTDLPILASLIAAHAPEITNYFTGGLAHIQGKPLAMVAPTKGSSHTKTIVLVGLIGACVIGGIAALISLGREAEAERVTQTGRRRRTA